MIVFVPGIPIPKGSSRAFVVNKKTNPRAVVTSANAKTKPWQEVVSAYAKLEWIGEPFQDGVRIALDFRLPRPKEHYSTGRFGQVKASRIDRRHTSKPDIDKLVRCVLDALTGICWRDDSQVVSVEATKEYTAGGPPGVTISVTPKWSR